jgi:hypothetical protein
VTFPPFIAQALVVSLLFAVGCKPSAGSSCDKGEARCLDAKRELVCQAGKFIETPCAGPRGCGTSQKGTSCDFSGNRPGDPCSADDEGAATCSNHDALLACHGGVYARLPCRGAHGCVNDDGHAACDTSIAEPNDVCGEDNLKACSTDGSQVLICKQHTMQRFYSCRGQNGCASSAGKLSCDTSVAKLGDACDKKLEGQAFSCTPEADAILVCRGGAFGLDQACRTGEKCTFVGTATRCSKPGK